MNKFQIIIIVIAIGIALMAVLLLSGVIPGFSLGGGGGGEVTLVMWGSFPREKIENLLSFVNGENSKSFNINYIQKNQKTYENELINALASGQQPDLWLLSHDFILKHKDKVFLIPFTAFSERAFKDTFIEAGELYLLDGGIAALPFIIDPIVLYWNRDLLANAGLSRPPKTWDEFVNFSMQITVKDESGNIVISGAGLGEFQNVEHAEEIISMLMLQTGNPIVNRDTLRSTLSLGEGSSVTPGQQVSDALRFFAEFSDSAKTTYSWNRSLPGSKNAFIGGTLVFYFGYASEYNDIKEKNPHLNFDVAEVPQIKDAKIKSTFARMEGVVVSKSSPNIEKAVFAASQLTGKRAISILSGKAYLPPVRRDLLLESSKDPVLEVFYKSAISGRAWLEPDPLAVSDMFKTMVESVLTGRKKISEAIRDAHIKLDLMLTRK